MNDEEYEEAFVDGRNVSRISIAVDCIRGMCLFDNKLDEDNRALLKQAEILLNKIFEDIEKRGDQRASIEKTKENQ